MYKIGLPGNVYCTLKVSTCALSDFTRVNFVYSYMLSGAVDLELIFRKIYS